MNATKWTSLFFFRVCCPWTAVWCGTPSQAPPSLIIVHFSSFFSLGFYSPEISPMCECLCQPRADGQIHNTRFLKKKKSKTTQTNREREEIRLTLVELPPCSVSCRHQNEHSSLRLLTLLTRGLSFCSLPCVST